MADENRPPHHELEFWRFYERSKSEFEHLNARLQDLRNNQSVMQLAMTEEIKRGLEHVKTELAQNVKYAVMETEQRLRKEITESVLPLTTWKTYVLGGAAVMVAVGTVLGPVIIPWLVSLFRAAPPGAGK